MYSVLLYTHLGLGDQIMCNGFVREYCGKYDRVSVFATPRTYTSVQFMYRDLSNLEIIKLDAPLIPAYIEQHRANYAEIKKIGYDALQRDPHTRFEKEFYALAGVDFKKKWESFHVVRDHVRERYLFERIAPKTPYAFLHEDSGRRYLIKRRMVASDLPIVEPDPMLTENIFDYCSIIENAREIHVIDSSFMFLIDCLPYENPSQKLYVHRYARQNSDWHLPVLKKNWTILGINTPSLWKRILDRLAQS
ncbi:MAG: hypothetical protein Athens041674_72 [Parcubacteria group bacterium Athens0416_74]|nr:MAG: hypothetical protein Athens041674_72 [Parcubacteria group bacterium Athens0416_74]